MIKPLSLLIASAAAVLLLPLLMAPSACGETPAVRPTIETKAPEFELQSVEGNEVSLAQELKSGPVALLVLRGYPGCASSSDLMFPVDRRSPTWPLKTPVLEVWTENAARAYPVVPLGNEQRTLLDSLDGKEFTLEYNPQEDALRVVTAAPGVQWMYSYWFAWYAFRPDTQDFRP